MTEVRWTGDVRCTLELLAVKGLHDFFRVLSQSECILRAALSANLGALELDEAEACQLMSNIRSVGVVCSYQS